MESQLSELSLAPASLDALPADLIIKILMQLATDDLGRTARVSREFTAHVEAALRSRAASVAAQPPLPGFSCRHLAIPDALPDGETSWVQFLCWRERRSYEPRCTVAAGATHSFYVSRDRHAAFFAGQDVQRYFIAGLEHHLTEDGPQPNPNSVQPFHTANSRRLHSIYNPQPQIFGDVVALSTSAMHSLHLTEYGACYSWGDGECGKLGNGDEQPRRTPKFVYVASCWMEDHARAAANGEPPPDRMVSIATGQQHSLVLSDHGVVCSFGSGFSGKLGHGTQASHSLPRPIAALRAERATAIAAGTMHSLVCTASGALYTFGYGLANQLGHGGKQNELAPRRVEALAGVRIVLAAGGEHHSLVIDDAGAVYSFGAGEAAGRTAYSSWVGGWLGHGTLDEVPLPRKIAALAGCRAKAVAAASRHSLVLVEDGDRSGAVYSFGDGGAGKLGHGDARSQWTPKRIQGLAGIAVQSIAAGEAHSVCATDSSFYAWGSLATGLREAETEAFPQPAPGSAGNYEWAPSDVLLERQAHAPKLVEGFYDPAIPE